MSRWIKDEKNYNNTEAALTILTKPVSIQADNAVIYLYRYRLIKGLDAVSLCSSKSNLKKANYLPDTKMCYEIARCNDYNVTDHSCESGCNLGGCYRCFIVKSGIQIRCEKSFI